MNPFSPPLIPGLGVALASPGPEEKILQRISSRGLSYGLKASRMAEPHSELVMRSQRGDAAAFEELAGRHQHMIHALTYRMTGSLADAEDLAQETFLRAWEEIGHFRGAAKFSIWRLPHGHPDLRDPAVHHDDPGFGGNAFVDPAADGYPPAGAPADKTSQRGGDKFRTPFERAMNEPAAKIKMIRASLRCLTFGCLGLLPAIGLPFALAALWSYGQARRIEKRFWNPARPQRLLGVILAGFGTIEWLIVGGILVFQAVTDQ